MRVSKVGKDEGGWYPVQANCLFFVLVVCGQITVPFHDSGNRRVDILVEIQLQIELLDNGSPVFFSLPAISFSP